MSREQKKYLELGAAAGRCRRRAARAPSADLKVLYRNLADLYDTVRIRVAAGHTMSLGPGAHLH
jgi:hypothetical protein